MESDIQLEYLGTVYITVLNTRHTLGFFKKCIIQEPLDSYSANPHIYMLSQPHQL